MVRTLKTKIEPIENTDGVLSLPGDKSISHRAVMFSAMAKGKSIVKNYLDSADLHSTIDCFRALGVDINIERRELKITGKGYRGFMQPANQLYAGNSGTTARLLSGILSAQTFDSVITGDESLSKRPMDRITSPLSKMGAKLKSTDGHLPLYIYSSELNAVQYTLHIASAQVKSAILLAGVHLEETTTIIEPAATRNHTELMLGLPVRHSPEGNVIKVNKSYYPEAREYIVPSDISTAAFFIVLTLIMPNGSLLLKNVLLNRTRAGIINVLKMMGGNIEVVDRRTVSGEEVGDLFIQNSDLKNIEIPKELIPNIIDEIPILSVAGLFAEGEFTVRNASELRAKESDRIKALVENYKLLNAETEEYEDGFSIGEFVPQRRGIIFNSFNDHRIAMAFAVLATQLPDGAEIEDFECVNISNPLFLSQLKSVSK